MKKMSQKERLEGWYCAFRDGKGEPTVIWNQPFPYTRRGCENGNAYV